MSLHDDLLDHAPSKLHSTATNVAIGNIPGEQGRAGGAVFDGRTSVIEVADHPSLHLAGNPFSLALWLHTDAGEGDVVGDLVSCYNPDTRTGFTLSVASMTCLATGHCASVRDSTPPSPARFRTCDSTDARCRPSKSLSWRPGGSVRHPHPTA